MLATPSVVPLRTTATRSDVPLGPTSTSNVLPEARIRLPPTVSVPIVPIVPGAMMPVALVRNGVLIRPLPVSRPLIRK